MNCNIGQLTTLKQSNFVSAGEVMGDQNVCPNKIGYDHNVGKALEYSENCTNFCFMKLPFCVTIVHVEQKAHSIECLLEM